MNEPDEIGSTTDTETARKFMDMLEVSGAARTAEILAVAWSKENDDGFLWSMNGCSECGCDLVEGEPGYVWGKPINNELGCKYVTLVSYCGQECMDGAISKWADELGMDVYAAYHSDIAL